LAVFVGISGLTSRAQNVLVSGNTFGGDSPQFSAAIDSLGYNYTFVSPANFGATSLSGYSAIWLDGFSQFSPGTPGNPGLSSANLVNFMDAGGVVFVQNPGFGSDSLSSYPFGGGLGAAYTYPPGENTVRLTGPQSPVNANLTGAGLSGWNASAYGYFTSVGSFTGVSDNGTSGNWLTLVRPVGAGELVYTEQGLAQRLEADPTDAQALQMLGNVLGLENIPEPSPGAMLAAGGVAALVLWQFGGPRRSPRRSSAAR
jgi:hypothetical protein